jgi:hypothetical protein
MTNGKAWDNEFSSALYPSLASYPRVPAETERGVAQGCRHYRSSDGVSCGDVADNLLQIGKRSPEPEDLHEVRK